jgi:hypothetical protein
MSQTKYQIDPVFGLPDQFWSIDMADNVLTEDVGDQNIIGRANEVFTRSMTLTKGRNDLDEMRSFFMQYILLGEKTTKGYPTAILPGLMRRYGIPWRDFIHEYGTGDRKNKAPQDITRHNIVRTALWMCAAYWLTPDWLYNATYPELINYRRWINPNVLSYGPWGDAIRANPCIFEEGLRAAWKPWEDKVMNPLMRERKRWALKNFGRGRHPKDVKLAIAAVFYKKLYTNTLKEWYETAQKAWTGNPYNVPVVQELPTREAQRRVSQKRKGEQIGSRQSPNTPTKPKTTLANTGKTPKKPKTLRDVTNEHRKTTDPMGAIYDTAPTGGSTRAVAWNKIDARGKTAQQWFDEALGAGLRDAVLSVPQDKRWGAVWGAYRSRGGSKAEADEMRGLIGQLDAIPATGDVRDEAEYAELQAEAEARREITNRNRDREMMRAPVEPEPTPEVGRYAETEPLTEEELVEQETRYESRKSDVPPPPGGSEIPWAVPH